jgi:hypothetical protein
MKRFRLLVASALVSLLLGACSNPTAPKYPQEKEDPNDPTPPPSQGLHFEVVTDVFFV